MPLYVGTDTDKYKDGTHVEAALLGDSYIDRHRILGFLASKPNLGIFNVANCKLGSPFEFTTHLGVGGSRVVNIFSRIPYIPAKIKAVFIIAGLNDVNNIAVDANQAAIDAAFNTASAAISSGITRLVEAGKIVAMTTIPPNALFTPATNSRIQLLDRLNTFIASLASTSVYVIDIFTALWDETQPTVRLFKTNVSVDGAHITSVGTQLAGAVAIPALSSIYDKCKCNINIYENFIPCYPLYVALTSNTGGALGQKTIGTGTIPDGVRVYGTAPDTITYNNASFYSPSDNYIGHAKDSPVGVDERFFTINVAAVGTDKAFTFKYKTDLLAASTQAESNSTIFPGDVFFAEVDVVQTGTLLAEPILSVFNYFTQGTSPVDQAFQGSTYVVARANTTTDFSSTEYPAEANTGEFLRTPVMRCPENVDKTAAFNLVYQLDLKVYAGGSGVIKIGRPRLWRKTT